MFADCECDLFLLLVHRSAEFYTLKPAIDALLDAVLLVGVVPIYDQLELIHATNAVIPGNRAL